MTERGSMTLKQQLVRILGIWFVIFMVAIAGFGAWWTIHVFGTAHSVVASVVILMFSYLAFVIVLAIVGFFARYLGLAGLIAFKGGQAIQRKVSSDERLWRRTARSLVSTAGTGPERAVMVRRGTVFIAPLGQVPNDRLA